MLLGILHLVQDNEDPYRIVTELMATLAPGSYLVISHPASDIHQPTEASPASADIELLRSWSAWPR
jgi:S-adenosyl methyltransferase